MLSFGRVQEIREWFLDLLFPVRCIGCGKDKEWLCAACLKRIPCHQNFFCPVCGHFSFYGAVCFSCRKQSFLDGAWCISSYHDPVLREAIKLLKYRYVRELSFPLANLVDEYLRGHVLEKTFDGIIPVPLHRRRMLEREFNQSAFLAEKAAQYFHCAVLEENLERKKFTFSQSKLSTKQRERNVEGAFEVLHPGQIFGKRILLVDDVFTSGSTLQSCARTLKESGAREVWGLILARG